MGFERMAWFTPAAMLNLSEAHKWFICSKESTKEVKKEKRKICKKKKPSPNREGDPNPKKLDRFAGAPCLQSSVTLHLLSSPPPPFVR